MTKASVLLVDDDSEVLLSLAQALLRLELGVELHTATNASQAINLARSQQVAVVVMDLCLEAQSGVESGFALLRALLEQDPTCRVIVLTGHGSIEHGVRSLTLGAASFVEKPADLEHLAALLRDGVKQADLRRAYDKLQREQAQAAEPYWIGVSAAAATLRSQIEYAAANNQPVLITGETGTGKGLCAATIHRLSARSRRSFVRYQPLFSSADLVNSDLFGHLKGAFTGAVENRRGLLADADQGTLLLDEVDELPLSTQISLLGTLQEGTYRPLGSNKEQCSDIRLLAASNQKIEQCLESGKLRSDFYHRIAHYRIEIPPLRERKDDLAVLVEYFLKKSSEKESINVFHVQPEVVSQLRQYHWPGNVRELAAQVESAACRAAYAKRTSIGAADFHLSTAGERLMVGKSFNEQVQQFKGRLIKEALLRNGNNQVQAAKELGLERSTLRRFLAKMDTAE